METAEQGFIQIFQVSKAYENSDGHTQETPLVLENVNLKINKGEFHILLGPSGCGKSTLLSLIAGYIPKSGGSIRVAGKRGSKAGRGPGRGISKCGFSHLPWLTVKGNVEFGLKMKGIKSRERRSISSQYLKLVGLKEHVKKYPNELSGGMKQRLQIARSLANDSEILIMDEPFGALDAHNRRLMQIELVKIWQQTKKTIIFVTHDITEAILLGQRISIMSKSPEATIYQIYDVSLDYPRNVTSKEFNDLFEQVQGHFDYGQNI